MHHTVSHKALVVVRTSLNHDCRSLEIVGWLRGILLRLLLLLVLLALGARWIVIVSLRELCLHLLIGDVTVQGTWPLV